MKKNHVSNLIPQLEEKSTQWQKMKQQVCLDPSPLRLVKPHIIILSIERYPALRRKSHQWKTEDPTCESNQLL